MLTFSLAVVNNSPYNDAGSKKPPAAAKSVSFIPMSPKSSHTMEMHRRQQELAANHEASQDEYDSGSDQDTRVAHHRRSSDSTHDRPQVRGRGLGSDSDEEVEDLPDRFDSQGRPLDRRSTSHDRWTSRSGDFRRQPQRPGDWDIRGAWHVGGTDNAAVERLANGVTNALDGRGSWMHVIGEVLGGGALGANPNGEAQQQRLDDGRDENHEDERRRRRRRRD
ncbi:hypothetical protein NLG97_g11299 [Lecanicillium saksenae]|uniref:Uncharacterized protein n=1 Tax=Lecanicillium saksenae TaxID=468837 RepID=A0ACC1QBA3_9HYPO|nr:hypothetical protein NLG97_g11299 [Lecanicillium saksenae]